MRLSVENYTLRKRYGDEKAIQMLKKAGFDCVDYSFYGWEKEDDVLNDNYLEHAGKVRTLLDENGLICNQAHAPFVLRYGCRFDVSDEEYKRVVRSIIAAATMGAEYIVVHPILVPIGEDLISYNIKYYKSLELYCKKFHIRIAIENMFLYDEKCKCIRGWLHTPELMKQIVNELQSEWFVLCLDIGHAALTGYAPEEMIRQFDRNMLQVLHIHDNDYLGDRHTIPYAGSFDWNKIMQALKDIGYNKDFTFEIPGYLKKMDDEFMDEALVFAEKIGKHLIKKVV